MLVQHSLDCVADAGLPSALVSTDTMGPKGAYDKAEGR